MVSLIEGKIIAKKAPKEPVSFSFEKGLINYISFEEAYKFQFLKLKDQSLESGQFTIDETTIYPNEDNGKSLFFLTVNSLITLHLCFVCESENKKLKLKEVQDALILLRDLPTETDEGRHYKINAILHTISEQQPAYVLMDLNDEKNADFDYIKYELEKVQDMINIIVLEKAPIQQLASENDAEGFEIEETYELSIGKQTQIIVTKDPKTKKESNDGFTSVFKKMLKEELMAFLSFIAPSLGVITFILLSPLYAQTNKVLLIPFIITIIICFALFMLMTYKCAIHNEKNEIISYLIISSLSILIAYGLSIGIYFLFVNFDADIKALGSKNITGIIWSIVATIILMSASLYVKPIGFAIKKLISKKK